jgi:hypothetical protein
MIDNNINDVYHRMGTTPPKSADQASFERLLIMEAISKGMEMCEQSKNVSDTDTVESVSNEIKALEAKLELLREAERVKQSKSPIEEAYKRVYSEYPKYSNRTEWDIVSWDAFFRGYMYVVNNLPTHTSGSTPEFVECKVVGPPPPFYTSWADWFKEEGSKGIIKNVIISKL